MKRLNSFLRRSELAASLWALRRELVIVAIFSGAANVLMLVPTLYMLQVYDRVLVSMSELTLLAISLIALFLFGVLAMSEWMRSRVLVRAGLDFDARLSARVFDASFQSSLGVSAAAPTRAFGDLLQLRQFLTGNGVFALFDAPWAPIYIAVTFMLHPALGVLALVFALVQAGLAWFGHRRTVAPAEASAGAAAEVNAYLHSKLRNAEVIESMGMIENLRQRWRTLQEVALGQGAVAQRTSDRVMAWSKFIRYSQQSLSLAAGALLVIDGQLSPGAMIAANLLMGRALAPIDQLVSVWRSFATTRSAFERLEQLLSAHPERAPRASMAAPRGELSLRNVCARVPGRSAPILKDLTFSVPAGTVLAVLGPSGSGKSTLARVMMGLWPSLQGEVLVDGVPIGMWDRAELGPHLGYLPQDLELFDGTIAENIARMGEVDSERVIEAARTTGLHDMILRMPKGYDTPIGEAGRLLSGGQRQRIALARSVYGHPALLVLDEPNANLDDTGEAALRLAVQQFKARGRTVVLITHRPGILSVADHLLLLRDGTVQAFGPREVVLSSLRAAQAKAKAQELSPSAAIAAA